MMNNLFFQKIKKITKRSNGILNGIVGDKLHDTPLGIKMSFYHENKPLILDRKHLTAIFAPPGASPSAKICILIHGLADSETTWAFRDKSDYGTLLKQDFDVIPFYLRYNSGLHISQNGQALAALITELYKNYPIELEDICIIAHSMGGLVAHSACYYAQASSDEWPQKIKNIFLLATPHLGSFLEKFANVTTNILEKIPNWPTRLVGKVINWRSAGIKDLRFGYLTHMDWENQHPDRLLNNNKSPVPKLPDHVRYYVISARLTQNEQHWVSQLFGDILVRTKSATARSNNKDEFNFPAEHHYQFPKMHHLKLTNSKEVYEKIKSWITTGLTASPE